jgi:ATP-dependent DNA helicase RecG
MMSVSRLTLTVGELIRNGVAEREFLEFKENLLDVEKVGTYISALANSASIEGEPYGYVLWGIDDQGTVVGTTANPWAEKAKGNEDFIPWLRRAIKPGNIDFEFQQIEIQEKRLIVLQIERASDLPVRFLGVGYIRIGSYTKDLQQFPAKEIALWKSFDQTPFEERVCMEMVASEDVARLLSLETYRKLTGQPPSNDVKVTLSYLEQHRLLRRDDGDHWSIFNLGALCLSARLTEFPSLQRKAVRFVVYDGNNRGTVVHSIDGTKGYVVGFEGLLDHIESRLPVREVTDPIRRTVEQFPRISVRELIANALIHQDLKISGSGPLVELFSDRLEISSPGVPLLSDTRRLLDSPARSRNEPLANFMRKTGICEERGSGIDKAALAAEDAQLPAPEIRISGDNTVAVLLGPRSLNEMDSSDRINSTYLHAALRHVNQQEVTNATVRERFGLEPRESSRASRLLSEAVAADLVRPRDASASKKHTKYVPYWA